MGNRTGIQWTDATWPIVTGCTHISSGCDHCYAARLTSTRLRHRPEYAGLAENGRFNGQVRCLPDRLDWPLHWRKPRKIFVCDMADLFHESVPDGFIGSVWDVMGQTPRHTYQVLTKRHARMRSLLRRWEADGWAWRRSDALWCGPVNGPLPNVWCGVSCEDQKRADIRIPALLETPAAIRFLSCEPLLGPINLRGYLCDPPWVDGARWPPGNARERSFDWVIVGGESGPNARPCELGWIEDIVEQCHAAQVPVFVKQFGASLGREFGAGSHGADWEKWPAYLQHRHYPRAMA